MKATKIWNAKASGADVYADFKGEFDYSGNAVLRIACDGCFDVKLSGKSVGFGSCQDYPHYREYFEFKLDCEGRNELDITVWHLGENSQRYIASEPFLAFEISSDEKVLLRSDSAILSRVNPYYKAGYKKVITGQMGFSYLFDATKRETEYGNSEELGEIELHARKLENLVLLPADKAVKCEKTDFGFRVDLGRETVGFLEMDFVAQCSEKITVAYGEHLLDGKVRRLIDGRDFSVEYISKKGENKFINRFRRLAGRYLDIYAKHVSINSIVLREVMYPTKPKPVPQKLTGLDRDIYETAVRTLMCCRHERYEDCPWREQAMYVLDSRNQMLIGYEVFENADYQRDALIFMARGIRDDGMMPLCFPTGKDIPIPFFSLMFPVAAYEFSEYTGETLAPEVLAAVKKVMSAFDARAEESGLIADLPYPYWNFYEWSDGANNSHEISRGADDNPLRYDLILNCAYVYAKETADKIFGTVSDLSATKQAIKNTFYIGNGKFRLSTDNNSASKLGNAFALIAGVGDGKTAEAIVGDASLIPETLSMKGFVYDALLMTDERYSNYVLNDIRANWGKMLLKGATTFWETELGADDFGGAGSLCHGWSAIPVHYLLKLL